MAIFGNRRLVAADGATRGLTASLDGSEERNTNSSLNAAACGTGCRSGQE